MDIQLKFINLSEDEESYIAICQKNLADGTAVAWQVIDGCQKNDSYDFTYPLTTCVAVEDEWGDESDLEETSFGQRCDINLYDDELEFTMQAASGPRVIEVKNCLQVGTIDAGLYKDGKLVAAKPGLAPTQVATFELDTYLWLGVVPEEAEEGDLIDPGLLTTQISLMGIKSAEIVMTGGGKKPVEFVLQNVVM